ncbi:AraC family transcriptional regulator [Paenibacillus bouchesdurhonensis]|uniref:AraC family transcriptional regulator n=1 Tax=Paenibacillus bouchesdurhonensis TaxID=1870990 RepID=UPI000DA63EB1|nr:AraC family transcriptional regulator [Paenibacillus bouchesdurhonensis]
MSRIDIVHFNETFQNQMDLNLLFFGMEECLSGHAWGPGLRDCYIIHYVHEGSGRFRIDDRTYELTRGHGFLIPPETLVYYEADAQCPWTYSWIGFRGLHAKSLLQRANLFPASPVFYSNSPVFEAFYDDLARARSERGGDVLIQSILYRVMAELIACSPPDLATEKKTSYPKEVYVRKAIEWIESSYSQKISVMDIARSVGLDRTYLSGLFKAQFGVSLQTFLLEYRMNRAVELLRNPDLSVSDVSRSVGYTDPFLFSKMFKKVIGQSPRASRKRKENQAYPK